MGSLPRTAVGLSRALRNREVSAREVVEHHLRRIEAHNPSLNAIVTLTPERALEAASRADQAMAAGRPLGPLHGIPVAHKDLQETAGVRTTYGSLLYRDHVPASDSLLVERVAAAGGISLGKTNTPEFGTGSHTYNAVFGTTRNPYDTTRSAGGSSGGAAAALAAGFVALADGSDMAGSLRNPASFCNVVGLRPSAGRVPAWPHGLARFDLAVDGPMARTVADVALLLSVVAGHDDRDPLALPGSGAFLADLEGPPAALRVGWLDGLGQLPFDRRVREVLHRCGRPALEDLAARVVEVDPDLAEADDAFRMLRGWYYAVALGPEADRAADQLNPDVLANIEFGRTVTAADLARAEQARTRVWHEMRTAMSGLDVLAMPATQVPPFNAEQRWVTEIDGRPMGDYLEWMSSAYWVSTTGLPAVSLPCGFTPDGLPVGIQLVGRPRGEHALLRAAAALEQRLGPWQPPPQWSDDGARTEETRTDDLQEVTP